MSDQQPGPPQNPYGQPQGGLPPQGAPQDGTPPVAPPPWEGTSPYGSPAGYGAPAPAGDSRPTTVTAAGWITIVLSALSALLFGVVALMMLVARQPIIDELERQPEFRDLDIDPDAIMGVLVVFMLVLLVWSLISVVLGVLVLRRSNVARILLVISAAVVAVLGLISIMSGLSAIWLIAALATIVLLFVGGAGDWFARRGETAAPW